ncbi:MAG: hypothetical protein ACT4QA_15505 [Panacagrimonas sp.]
MNTFFRTSILAAAASAVFVSAAASAYTTGTYRWVASATATGTPDTNWFNPANWSTGQVPGPGNNVDLDANDYVVIDQARNPTGGKVQVQDLHVRDGARFEVINGAVVQTRDQVLHDRGRIIFRASGDVGESVIVANDCRDCVQVQNPTQQNKRIVVLQSSVTVDVGLGGTTPASLVQDGAGGYQLAAGRGHYSTTTAETMVIDGDLKLSTYYGFEPRPGDSFQIMTINGSRSGEFIGLPEGGYVGCTDRSVGMRISYRGGDGNDIVISAEQTGPVACLLLPAVQKIREAASRR